MTGFVFSEKVKHDWEKFPFRKSCHSGLRVVHEWKMVVLYRFLCQNARTVLDPALMVDHEYSMLNLQHTVPHPPPPS